MAESDVFLVRVDREESLKKPNRIAKVLYEKIRPPNGLTGLVPIKVHVGEKSLQSEDEIKTHISPDFLKPFVSLLRNDGACDVVMTDSTVNYANTYRGTPEGHKELARMHGFGEGTIGIPFVVADEDGSKTIRDEMLGDMQIPSLFHKVAQGDGYMLALTHFTGHCQFGYAGVLKNLGMGFVGRETKARTHRTYTATVDSDKCVGCGVCVDICTHGYITLDEDDGEKACVDPGCLACGICVGACEYEALSMGPRETEDPEKVREKTYDLVIMVAKGSSSIFKPGHLLHIVDLTNVTIYCDCDVRAVRHHDILAEDIGCLASPDPVALDQACMDLILKECSEDQWHEKLLSVFPYYRAIPLSRQIDTATRLGMGNKQYKLHEIRLS